MIYRNIKEIKIKYKSMININIYLLILLFKISNGKTF